jgi:Arm DNA-binding domain
LVLRVVSLSYALIVYRAFIWNMPRPRRDGTPARPLPNRRRLTDAFIRTVQPDPDRAVVYWDTLQRGLALKVQPSGHLAWKCVYTLHGRGPRWYSIGDAKAITLPDARKLAAKLMYQVVEGGDPHADRLALRGRGSFGEVALRYVDEHARKKIRSTSSASATTSAALPTIDCAPRGVAPRKCGSG